MYRIYKSPIYISLSLHDWWLRALTLRIPHVHHTPDAIARLHVLERRVDLVQGLPVRDELVDFQLARQVVVDQVRELRAALDAAERAPFPHAAGDELECWLGGPVVSAGGGSKGGRGGGCAAGGHIRNLRRVLISWPAAATPMTMLCPQPLWQASSAALITPTLPVQSKV